MEELLLDAGCLRNIRAKDGFTPLHTAAEFGAIQCLEHLLDCGKANPMERNMSNNWVPMRLARPLHMRECKQMSNARMKKVTN